MALVDGQELAAALDLDYVAPMDDVLDQVAEAADDIVGSLLTTTAYAAEPAACKEAAISEQSYYRWKKEYGGLKLDQAKKLKELERENARLKKIVADLSLEKAMLKEVATGNW